MTSHIGRSQICKDLCHANQDWDIWRAGGEGQDKNVDISVTSFMNAPLCKVAIFIKPKNCPVFKTQVSAFSKWNFNYLPMARRWGMEEEETLGALSSTPSSSLCPAMNACHRRFCDRAVLRFSSSLAISRESCDLVSASWPSLTFRSGVASPLQTHPQPLWAREKFAADIATTYRNVSTTPGDESSLFSAQPNLLCHP